MPTRLLAAEQHGLWHLWRHDVTALRLSQANPKEQRRTASYIYHYTCAEKMKYRQAVNHSNRVLARLAESWVLTAIQDTASSGTVSLFSFCPHNRESSTIQHFQQSRCCYITVYDETRAGRYPICPGAGVTHGVAHGVAPRNGSVVQF